MMKYTGKGRGRGGGRGRGKRRVVKNLDPGRIANSDHYEVEAAVDKRIVDGCTQYFLKWKGWPSETNTWEPLEHLNCPRIIHEYEARKYNESLAKDAPGPSGTQEVERKRPGYERGLKASSISDAFRSVEDGVVYFLVKWENADFMEFVPAKVCHKLFPELSFEFCLTQMNLEERCLVIKPDIFDELWKDTERIFVQQNLQLMKEELRVDEAEESDKSEDSFLAKDN